MGDEFVGPEAGGEGGYDGAEGVGVVVFGERGFVGHEGHEVAELWGGALDDGDVVAGLSELGGAVDAADAGLGGPFAVDGGGFNKGFESVVVRQLEVADLRVVRVFEEDGLAVASVLKEKVSDDVAEVLYTVDLPFQLHPSTPL